MSFGSVGDWLSVGAAPFTGGASLLASPTIRGGLGDAASGVGDAASSIGVPGQNRTQATTFGQTQQYDPSKFQYGPSGGNQEAAGYHWAADQAQGRQASQADFSGAQPNFYRANQWDQQGQAWDAQSQQARQQQAQAAGLMMNRATGATPSIAGMQAGQDIGLLQQNAAQQARAAQAAQTAQMASARGGAGVALAQQNAANNTANAYGAIGQGSALATQNVSNQAQINAANERLQAEQGAFGAYAGMRQGDTTSQGMSYQGQQNAAQQAQFGAQIGSQQAQFNAQLQAQQRAQNDAMSLGNSQLAEGVNQAQLNAGVAQQGLLAGSFGQQQGYQAQVGQANANNAMDWVKAGIGAASGSMRTPTGPKPMAKGGPIHAGGLYLVGERGPELIVPQHSGTVIPNHQLRGLY